MLTILSFLHGAGGQMALLVIDMCGRGGIAGARRDMVALSATLLTTITARSVLRFALDLKEDVRRREPIAYDLLISRTNPTFFLPKHTAEPRLGYAAVQALWIQQ